MNSSDLLLNIEHLFDFVKRFLLSFLKVIVFLDKVEHMCYFISRIDNLSSHKTNTWKNTKK
jgi:hypothetical protein